MQDEAIGSRRAFPERGIGCVEVRPIAEDDQTLHALGLAAARAAAYASQPFTTFRSPP